MRAQAHELQHGGIRLTVNQHQVWLDDAKIEKITLQLAQLKAWKFGAKTEAMSAEKRRLFEETFAEDEASLQAQLEQAKAQVGTPPATAPKPPRKPRRQPLPEHLRREEHHHERIAAGGLAHARTKFDELLRETSKSAVAVEALHRIAQIYRAERELAPMSAQDRLAARQAITRPLWEQLHVWGAWSEAGYV